VEFPKRFIVLLWAGRLSYGIYLLHLPVCSLALRVTGRVVGTESKAVYFGLSWLVAMLISVALAAVMFRAVELPALRARKFLPANRRLTTMLASVQMCLIPVGVAYAVVTQLL
jgi:peptidoglycan/LPS O-acetylase OafA/YrhL